MAMSFMGTFRGSIIFTELILISFHTSIALRDKTLVSPVYTLSIKSPFPFSVRERVNANEKNRKNEHQNSKQKKSLNQRTARKYSNLVSKNRL